MVQNTIKKNERKFIFNNVFHFAAVAILTGSVIQSFMVESGIGEYQVTIYVSMCQILQMLAMLLGSGSIDRSRNIIRTYAVLECLCIPLCILLVAFCFLHNVPANTKYLIILIVGGLSGFAVSLSGIASYKVPFHIIHMDSYGPVTAWAGAGMGICGMLISGCMTAALKEFAYFDVMKAVFIVTAVILLLAALSAISLKEVNAHKETLEENKSFNLFLYKPFYILLLPNLMRGICAGVFSIAAMIGYLYNILDSTTAAYLVIVTNIASLTGCFSYGSLSKGGKKIEGILVLIASMCITVLLPSMLIGNSSTVFLITFCIAYICYEIINFAVPVMVTRMVAYEAIGRYTSWRITIHTLGTAITGFICIPLLERFNGFIILLIAGLLQLASGTAYYIIEKKKLYL